MKTATLHTSKGPVTLELHADDAPKTVENFVKLAGQGFYDGGVFHRVIEDFMIQGGCPEGSGRGGPGYEFEDEINPHKVARGALAMANRGPNTNGSQFFIVFTDTTLPASYIPFGKVTKGLDVATKVAKGGNDGANGAGDGKPKLPISIKDVVIAKK